MRMNELILPILRGMQQKMTMSRSKPINIFLGLEPQTYIFQFRRTKSRIWFDNIFWFKSLLSATKKISQNKLARQRTNDICPCSWETTTKIASSYIILFMVGNSNGNLNYCIASFIECGPISLLRIQKELSKPPQLVYSVI